MVPVPGSADRVKARVLAPAVYRVRPVPDRDTGRGTEKAGVPARARREAAVGTDPDAAHGAGE